MADSSLDDFFAKKDKSKKSKKKFTTSDQIAKKLEESGKKSTEAIPKKEKEKVVSIPVSTSNISQMVEQVILKAKNFEDDEWRDFEEEKEKDYSGLKIQNLQISETKDDEYEKDNYEQDEDGEPIKTRDSNFGPWNKLNTAAPPETAPRPETPPVPVETKKKEDTKSDVYRPPHARLTPSTAPAGRHKQSSAAPEISSDFHFPTLSAAAETPKGGKKGDKTPDSEKGFESVKRGSRSSEEVVNRGPKLDLDNKFNAFLSHSDQS